MRYAISFDYSVNNVRTVVAGLWDGTILGEHLYAYRSEKSDFHLSEKKLL